MVNVAITPPLSNIQVELLKLNSTNISDETLVELKLTLSKFFLNKLRKEADALWIEKGYTDFQLSEID